MNTLLDDSFDTHWFYVDQFQKTTLNIIVKAQLNIIIDEDIFRSALTALQRKHTYLTASITTHKESGDLILAGEANREITHTITTLDQSSDNQTMEVLSEQLRKRLNLNAGELLNIHLYKQQSGCIIEFVCAHLLGDMTAVCLLFQDFLNLIDDAIDNTQSSTPQQQRLCFDEVRYGWMPKKIESAPFPLPKTTIPNDWPTPELDYQRFTMPLSQFKSIESTIKQANIQGTAGDLFYYVAARLFNNVLHYQPQFTTVQSFRPLLNTPQEQSNISTLAAFKPVNVNGDLLNKPKEWIENFSQQRQSGLKPEEILGLIHFLRSFNLSLKKVDEEQGKTALFQLIPINAFAFNNFGKLDSHFSGFQHFEVDDINCHDAVPGEFFRIYGFKEKVYFTPIFYKDSPLTNTANYWKLFTKELEIVLANINHHTSSAIA